MIKIKHKNLTEIFALIIVLIVIFCYLKEKNLVYAEAKTNIMPDDIKFFLLTILEKYIRSIEFKELFGTSTFYEIILQNNVMKNIIFNKFINELEKTNYMELLTDNAFYHLLTASFNIFIINLKEQDMIEELMSFLRTLVVTLTFSAFLLPKIGLIVMLLSSNPQGWFIIWFAIKEIIKKYPPDYF